MKTYDMECPVCGRLNRSLYLDETDGWMECEYCGSTGRQKDESRQVLLPILRIHGIKNTAAAAQG